MWQCDNCGYNDEEGTTFEEEIEAGPGPAVRFCPECGSDEVFLVDEEDNEILAGDEEAGTGDDAGEWGGDGKASGKSEEDW